MRFMQPRLGIEYAPNLKFWEWIAQSMPWDQRSGLRQISSRTVGCISSAWQLPKMWRDARDGIFLNEPNPQTPQTGGVLRVRVYGPFERRPFTGRLLRTNECEDIPGSASECRILYFYFPHLKFPNPGILFDDRTS